MQTWLRATFLPLQNGTLYTLYKISTMENNNFLKRRQPFSPWKEGNPSYLGEKATLLTLKRRQPFLPWRESNPSYLEEKATLLTLKRMQPFLPWREGNPSYLEEKVTLLTLKRRQPFSPWRESNPSYLEEKATLLTLKFTDSLTEKLRFYKTKAYKARELSEKPRGLSKNYNFQKAVFNFSKE